MKRRHFIPQILMGFSFLRQMAEASDLPDQVKMPVLFFGHGSPMNAIEQNSFTKKWQEIGQALPAPKAIVCISAHWETLGTKVTAMTKPKTIHDFGGFPQALFDVQYPVEGSPELAGDLQKSLAFREHIALDHAWGLDHGAWSVLKNLYPKAQIPVLQISLSQNKNPMEHYELGKALQFLRRKGVLVVGSGNMVHNLGMLHWQKPDSAFDWAAETNELFKQKIQSRHHKDLISYSSLGAHISKAIPTPEHYLPLLYVLGMQEEQESPVFFNDQIQMGSISMTSVGFGL